MASYRFMSGHLAVRLDTVFQTVKLPAGVPHLNTCLAYVDRDAFTLGEKREKVEEKCGRKKEKKTIERYSLRNFICFLVKSWKLSG